MSRYFSEDHEWIDVDGEIGTVGITDYAQSQLGDIVFVEVPDEGKELAKGDDAAVVESVSFGVENLSGDPQLESLLTRRDEGEAIVSLTSDTAITFCLSVFHRFDVDWKLHGFDAAALRELAEMTLRTVQSLLTDHGQVPRTGLALRGFIARWLGPAILYPRLTSLSAQGSVIGNLPR